MTVAEASFPYLRIQMKLYVYPSDLEGQEYHYVSLLDPGYVSVHGLTVRSIIGKLKNAEAGISGNNIIYNPVFITLFHKSVRDALANDPSLIKEAECKENGFIYVIDARAKANEDVRTEDVIGAFPVNDSRIVKESYLPSPKYQLISSSGKAFIIPAAVQQKLIAEITATQQ